MSLRIREAPSPNQDERPEGAPVDMLVLHYTGMRTGREAVARLRDPAARVSSHYVVEEDGAVWRLVPESRRAWHAGVSHWRGQAALNGRSIGIEVVNPGHEFGYRPFPALQMAALCDLCLEILARHPIAPRDVVAHSDVAPDRKEDPGELFDWRRLAAAGVGLFVEPARIRGGRFLSRGDRGTPVEALQSLLASYGYAIESSGAFDASTEAVVRAFQRHFRQARVDGIADTSTVETLRALLDRKGSAA